MIFHKKETEKNRELEARPVHVKKASVTPPGAAPAVGDVELHLILAVCPAPLKLDSADGRAHRGALSNAAAVQVLGKRFDFSWLVGRSRVNNSTNFSFLLLHACNPGLFITV